MYVANGGIFKADILIDSVIDDQVESREPFPGHLKYE